MVVGEVVLDELRRVLKTRFRLPAGRLTEVEDLLRAYEVVDKPSATDAVPVRDADEGWVLASARAGGVDALVTGDGDLLAVANQFPFHILSPRAFWLKSGVELANGTRQ